MKLINAKQLKGHALHARDGVIGQVRDFYFDDHRWDVRYCEVRTSEWLLGRRVLIALEVFSAYDWNEKVFLVGLTMEQIRNSPALDLNKPVSRQHEEALRRYYGWAPYWNPMPSAGGIAPAIPVPPPLGNDASPEPPKGDPVLRSVNDTVGAHIVARDGAIGHAEDVLIDTENWRIRYLVIDTKNWWPGRKVIIALPWVHAFNWANSEIVVDLTRDAIKGSPEYDPAAAWNPDYGARLHDYYRHLRQTRTSHKSSAFKSIKRPARRMPHGQQTR